MSKAARKPRPEGRGAVTGSAGLHPVPTKDDLEFVADLARFAEDLVSEADIKRKYRFGNDVWEKLGNDDELVRSIEAEKLRRVRDGSSKRERAQNLVVKAPTILDGIATDVSASPRHRVDAIKTLDAMAANGPAGAPAADRFVIQINIGDTSIAFNKSIRPLDPGEVDPQDRDPFNAPKGDTAIDDDPNGLIAAFAMKKKMLESGGGQGHL